MYIAMTLVKRADLSSGQQVNMTNDDKGVVGVLYAFETKAAARELFGDDIEVVEIQVREPG